MLRPRSLWALTSIFLLVFLVIAILTGAATARLMRDSRIALVDQRIAGENREVSGDAYPADPAALGARIAAFARQRETGDVGFLLLDAQGRRVAGNVVIDRRLPIGFSTLDARDGIAGLTHGRAYVRALGDGLTLTTLAETEPIPQLHSARARILLFGYGATILVVIGGVSLFGLLIRRRLLTMQQTVDAVIDGDLDRRVPVDGSGSEFDRQARSFNQMLDRITALMGGIANVSNDIAHDLRTPLARLHGELSRLERDAETPAMRAGLARAIEQNDMLLDMFAAILRIAEVQGGKRRAAFAPIDLGALVRDFGEMMMPVAEAEGFTLTLGTCAVAPIAGDRPLLQQALINLVENALHHGAPGGRIRLEVSRGGEEATLVIEDDGPGIAAPLRAEAMRRFGRLDKARTRPGHGLGLPLVEAIVHLHRGTIALEDAGPGLRVRIRLPVELDRPRTG